MRHACVGDDGIGDGTKTWELLRKRFKALKTPILVSLVTQLARLQLKDSEVLDSFFFSAEELLTGLQESGEAVAATLFNATVLNDLPLRFENFCKQERMNPATEFAELRKKLQNFYESAAKGQKGQIGSVAQARKQNFKKGPTKGNCCLCGIAGHFAKDCRRKMRQRERERERERESNAASVARRVALIGHARTKEMETKS